MILHDNTSYVIVQNYCYILGLSVISIFKSYLDEVLGSAVAAVRKCKLASSLPYFLQDSFDLLEVSITDRLVILAIPKAPVDVTLREIRTQLDKVSELLGEPVAYCPPTLASYERRNLIEQKVPFIVPGNQMYLPDLGIDLREYFKAGAKKIVALSPSTQAILIWQLLQHPAQSEWSITDLAKVLNYAAMTLTRAVRELAEVGLGESFTKGRLRVLRFNQSHAETWQMAQPYLRTPVKRVVWVRMNEISEHIRMAGFTALASNTMLVEPEEPCFAVSASRFSEMQESLGQLLPAPAPGFAQLQLWAYNPVWNAQQPTVDPLSLWLSLKDNSDDRVQMALDELIKAIQW
jgi:hypothetical protein